MPWGNCHARKMLADEAPDVYVPGTCTPPGEQTAGYPWAFQSAQDACLQDRTRSRPRGSIFQLSGEDASRVDVCFCLNTEDVHLLAIVTMILEQVPSSIYSTKSGTSHQLLLINVGMAVNIHRKSLGISFSLSQQKSFNWQQYCHEGWGKCSLVKMTAMENYNKMQLFFLTHQPPGTKQAQTTHFFFQFSTQEGIFVPCLQSH